MRFAALLLAGLAILAGGCGGSDPPRRAIFIMLDAARPDRISSYGYSRPITPRLDALAERGVLFENHFAQGTYTRTALPPLLYSRYYMRPLFPNSIRVPYSFPQDLFQAPDAESVSLPRALSGAGIHTVLISAHTWLKPSTVFAREFDEAHELSSLIDLEEGLGHHSAETAIDYAIRWLEENRHEEYFLYLHLMDTHFPHHPGEDARALMSPELRDNPPLESFKKTGRPKRVDRLLNGTEREYLDALYDGSFRYVDRQIGRLLDHLGDALDDTAVLFTSDHGEYLLEVPRRIGHGYAWYDMMGRIPLIVSYPGRLEPGRVDALTESVDVTPTVLSLLGVAPPEGRRFDGVDLAALRRGEIPRKQAVFMQRAIRTERWKAIFQVSEDLLLGDEPPGFDALSGRLFDLRADPGESENLWSEHPEVVLELLAIYRDRMRPLHRRYLAARRNVQPESDFAISIKYMRSDPDVPVTRELDDIAAFLDDGAGWIRLDDFQGRLLVANGEAKALELEFPVPDGPYFVTAAMRGMATFQVGEEGPVETLLAEIFDATESFPWKPENLELGAVLVEDQVFRMTLTPLSRETPFLLTYLGFQPIRDEPAADPEEERRRLEQLKTLGYVE